ncbi:Hpt domain-containing protein [Thiomicrorhabdus sediminis]|uniref:Hpt domain-containing protein n=1 Tax=Thiomicrorhabdus sediminis TaxID=2580412 RepID=A0A4P9K370_9GAMM|nr:Hpt domain-containing protein [Thiomicrorhabdus sediminis]QCU89289.1 Hpt domain-containing protein [Thiomicrorhabdus sediminis]
MHLDTDNLNALQAVIGEQINELLQIYLDSTPLYLQQIQNSLDALDFDNLQHAAHTLKGSAGNIGAADLADFCQQLEQQAKNQQSCALASAIEKLAQEAVLVEHEIHAFLGKTSQ